jgi:uncharacterized protein (TIGR00297 family)
MIFPSLTSIIAGLLFGVVIAFLAYQARALTRSGAAAAAILGWIVFGLGGWDYTAVLLVFFITSSALSFAFKKQKSLLAEKHAKGSRRDYRQVLANGGASGIMVLMHFLFPDLSWLWWAYCAGLAAANADTWASELGVLSKSKPRLITSLEEVEMGTSGGITWIGTLAALTGAFIIAITAILFHPAGILPVLIISLSGLAGCMVDSWMGATVQAVYYCQICKKETEKHPTHSCGAPTAQIRGLSWLDNDWVNAFCTSSGVFITLMIALITG